MPTVSSVVPAVPVPVPHGRAGDTRSSVQVLRALLVGGSLAVAVIAAALATPAAVARVDPDLLVLLRGMALIKAGMAVAAIALSWWRLGQPITARAAAGYVVGTASLVAASVLITYLRYIPAAALIFHAGLFGLMVLAWREGRFWPQSRGT